MNAATLWERGLPAKDSAADFQTDRVYRSFAGKPRSGIDAKF